MLRNLIVITLTAQALFACKSKYFSDVSVTNGKPLGPEDVQYKSVVQVGVQLSSNKNAICTASIVSEDTLLTAAHCLDLEDGAPASEAFAILPDNRITGGAIHINPAYNGSSVYADIAFVRFSAGTFAGYTPLEFGGKLPEVGDDIFIVGFGKYDHFDATSGGQKRLGCGVILGVSNTLDFEGRPHPDSTDCKNALNSQGDSGGPMLNKSNEIIGVSSTVDARDVKPGETLIGHYTSINAPDVAPFLQKFTTNQIPVNNNPSSTLPHYNGGGSNNPNSGNVLNGGGGSSGGSSNGGSNYSGTCVCVAEEGECRLKQGSMIWFRGKLPQFEKECATPTACIEFLKNESKTQSGLTEALSACKA